MIWFACKGCGRHLGRADNEAGSLVFCACGQSNVVPWESTVEPSAAGAAPPARPARPAPPPTPSRQFPAPRRLVPVPTDEEWAPLPRREPTRSRSRYRERDPAYCFNHEDLPSEVACGDCGVRFCRRCVLDFQAATLCGPCKNFRLRALTKSPRVSGLAITSVVLASTLSPLFLFIAPGSAATPAGPLLGIAACLLANLVTFVVGAAGLYFAETRPGIGGQSLAITGMASAVVFAALGVALAAHVFVTWV